MKSPDFVNLEDVQFEGSVFALLQTGMCWTLGLCDGEAAPYENDTSQSLRGCVS